MKTKEEKLVEKHLKELVKKDIEKASWRFAADFMRRNKREPNDKEMLACIKKAEKIILSHWKKIEKNPKKYLEFVKKTK